MEIFSLVGRITLDGKAAVENGLKQVDSKAEQLAGKLKQVGSSVTNAGGIMTKWVTGPIAAVGGGLLALAKSTASAGDEIQKMALRTGFSTEALSEYKHAAELSGTSLDSVEKAVKRMQKGLLDAERGMSTATNALDSLGLSVADLQGLSPEQQFDKMAMALASIEDPSRRAALAQEVFGRAGTELLPMLDAGADGIAAMRQEARDLGIVFDQEAADAAAQFNDDMDRLKKGFAGVFQELGKNLIPILVEDFLPLIRDNIIPIVQNFGERIGKIIEWFSNLDPKWQQVILTAIGFTAALGPLLSIMGKIITVVGTITGALPVLGTAFAALTGPVGIAIAAIAGLTAGGIALVKHLKKSSIEVDLWGDEVSKKTQEAVGSFLKLNDEATVALDQLAWSGQAVSEEMANSIIATFDEMGNQILTNMQEDHAQQLSEMQAFFAQSAALTDEEEAEILAGMEEHHQQEQQRVKDNQARIQEILNRAKEEKRAITDSERAIINQIQKEMTEQAVEYMSESEREQKVILERLKSEASKISAVQAAEVVKNSKEQKDKVISEAEQQYNETLAQIIKLRDEAGTITAEQADKLIEEATRQKEETILNAEEMHARIIKEAQAQAGEHIKQVDWETGEIKTKWEVMKDDIIQKAKKIKEDVVNKWEDIKKKSAETWDSVKTATKEKWDAVKSTIKGVLNGIIGFINKFIRFWNRIKLKVPEVNIPLVGKVGGFEIGLPRIPTIPELAAGGIIERSGLALVGEAGPELLELPQGAKVKPLTGEGIDYARLEAIAYTSLFEAFVDAMKALGKGEIRIDIDGRTLAREMIPRIIAENQRMGVVTT